MGQVERNGDFGRLDYTLLHGMHTGMFWGFYFFDFVRYFESKIIVSRPLDNLRYHAPSRKRFHGMQFGK